MTKILQTYLIALFFVFTGCDWQFDTDYYIENNSSEDLTIRTFSGFTTENTVAPGSTLVVFSLQDLAGNCYSDSTNHSTHVSWDSLIIESSLGQFTIMNLQNEGFWTFSDEGLENCYGRFTAVVRDESFD